ncbi:hypothetical protein N7519_009838 [Penicillium mononematosum]|uniref:uncharacterized protein n=1 Tax=Penicillium mononematosum TaxID=268346 RepID=UPI002547AD79|nr:uncharacterized protein N7519_009838 [Penicillium mononematosum]KAJ6179377.1 hypothetical protein N7519_009838 [Penicillium mononematosum]
MIIPTPQTRLEVNQALKIQGLKRTGDEKNLVGWDAMNPRHPRNWSSSRKAYDASIIIFLEFYTTAVSTSGATAARNAQHHFGIGETLSVFIYISTYLLAQGIGSIVLPPYSECYGRKKLYVGSTALYSIFCVLISAAELPAAGAIGRLITGFLSAVPSAVINGSMQDMFDTKEMIWLTLPYMAMANLGIAVGPVMSAYITAVWGWKWVFYVAAVVTGILTILLLAIRESRPTVLLTQEVRHLRRITGDHSLQALNPDKVLDLRSFARQFAFRPVQLLFTEPIVAAVSIVCGISTGLIYLFTDILPGVYESFGLTTTQASLPFLALGFGFLPNFGTRFLEYRKTARRRQRGERVIPEHKLTGYIIAAPVLMIALWWFAWTIPPAVHVHYSASVVPLFLTGFAINEFGIVLVGYMSDSYRSYSASGFAALGLVRCMLAASFPLFSGRMFSGLGPNKAMCVLASLATGFCFLSPVLRIYGERLRKSSKFAAHCVDVDAENTCEQT